VNESRSAHAEQPLTGGAQTLGIVRLGATVRRPRHPRSDFTQAVLKHLESVGFGGAPRALGYDDQRREVVSYIEGQVYGSPPFRLNDAKLVSASKLIRALHDATADSPLCGGAPVLGHGDLGPYNTVFRGDTAVAIIDWSESVAPAHRIVDFAQAVWCFGDLIESAVPVEEQARKARLMCAAYGGVTPAAVVTELRARFGRARAHHQAAGREAAVEAFDGLIAWLDVHGEHLASRS
jgi:Phosphotransferase enzyme family